MNQVLPPGVETISRINHELDLILSHEQLYNNYAQNTRRNIKKAHENDVTISRKLDTGDLVTLFRDNFGSREGVLKARDYKTIRHLITKCQKENRGHILGAFSGSGLLSAAAFFLRDDSRVYYLFAASAPEARDNGAMFMLIDHFLRENSGQVLTLDFEGGNDPNLGRFYKSFGAAEVPYPMIRVNRLPDLVSMGLYFARKMRL
jgi:lipid II:glycine glycyltransferase (peptidoglycan interpeptide bridge formation enzyme)